MSGRTCVIFFRNRSNTLFFGLEITVCPVEMNYFWTFGIEKRNQHRCYCAFPFSFRAVDKPPWFVVSHNLIQEFCFFTFQENLLIWGNVFFSLLQTKHMDIFLSICDNCWGYLYGCKVILLTFLRLHAFTRF